MSEPLNRVGPITGIVLYAVLWAMVVRLSRGPANARCCWRRLCPGWPGNERQVRLRLAILDGGNLPH